MRSLYSIGILIAFYKNLVSLSSNIYSDSFSGRDVSACIAVLSPLDDVLRCAAVFDLKIRRWSDFCAIVISGHCIGLPPRWSTG